MTSHVACAIMLNSASPRYLEVFNDYQVISRDFLTLNLDSFCDVDAKLALFARTFENIETRKDLGQALAACRELEPGTFKALV